MAQALPNRHSQGAPDRMLCIKNRLFCWLFGNAFSRGFFVRGVAPGTWTAGAQAPHPRASTDPPNLHSSNGLQRAAMGAHSPAGPLATGVDDLWPEPLRKLRGRNFPIVGGKAKPATSL
jgi:hypothetical protein